VPKVHKFQIIIPPYVSKQIDDYECGFYVCQWMLHGEADDNSYTAVCSNRGRLALAIILVKDLSNTRRSQIIDEARAVYERHFKGKISSKC
ncbi:unnamed protein product, partial [Linum tenue]